MYKTYEIVGVFEKFGVNLFKRGSQYMGLCPFHEDKEPSLSVHPHKGIWHCFGCKAKGSLAGFVEKMQGVSRFRAQTWIDEWMKKEQVKRKKIKNNRKKDAGQNQIDPVLKKYVPSNINQVELLNNVMRFYHKRFTESQESKQYLNDRGIHDEGLFDKFMIGYADGSLFKMMSVNENLKGVLQKIGILTKKGSEFFYECVVFPVFDSKGNCVEVYGRSITRSQHLYLPGPHKGVWNWEAFTKSKEIILTESIIDALSLYQIGYNQVVPLYGTNGLSEDHLKFLEIHRPDKLLIAFDGDKAGDEAACGVAERLSSITVPCFRVKLPQDTDINEYLNNGHTRIDFEKLIETAEPISVELEGKTGNVTVIDGLVEFVFGSRKYQVRELQNDDGMKLRVNIRAMKYEQGMRKDNDTHTPSPNTSIFKERSHTSYPFHVDVFDMYVSKTRKVFINACSRMFGLEPEVIDNDMSGIIEHLEKIRIKKEIKQQDDEDKVYEMSQEEEEQALELLKAPDLLDRIVQHLEVCGYVGEEINKKIGYLTTISRKLESPLSSVIISNSGAGKSKLMEHLASFVPEEDVVWYTRITPQALYYKEERSLKHKLIVAGEEEGLLGANYSIRELISSKVLRMAAPVKDPITGRMQTVEYEVEGPVSLMFSTTRPDIGYENATRCFVLSLDESREQTRKIQISQNEGKTFEGFQQIQDSEQIRKLNQNAQRLLRSLAVINPYAMDLSFPDHSLRTRRDHEKYLSMIEAVALLHQYQREVKTIEHRGRKVEYIEAAIEDIEIANELMAEIIGQNLDELRLPSRELLGRIWKMVIDKSTEKEVPPSDYKFNRRDVREYTGWSDDQIKAHIRQLEELQYLIVVTGQRGRMYKYELAYPLNEKDGKLIRGLTDTKKLREKYEKTGSSGV